VAVKVNRKSPSGKAGVRGSFRSLQAAHLTGPAGRNVIISLAQLSRIVVAVAVGKSIKRTIIRDGRSVESSLAAAEQPFNGKGRCPCFIFTICH